MSTSVCMYCHQTFLPQRRSAKYCSGKCRTAYHRLKREIKRRQAEAYWAVRKINTIVERFPELQPTADQQIDKLLYAILNELTREWKCPKCGQLYFGKEAPKKCAYCREDTGVWSCKVHYLS